jgi:sodium-dependent dicarboxylate transporter 2/3/5
MLLGKERHEKIDIDIEKHKWTRSQLKVLFIFLVVVLMWMFKSLIVYYLNIEFEDFGPALLGAMLLFITPSEKSKMLLEWKDTRNLPWGILILFGGGLALAKMFEANGVITEVSTMFLSFKTAGIVLILLVVVGIATFGTELMSNTALVAVFIPIIGEFALQSDYSIIQLCVPVTLAASCAFMLPVGTPPNAIVFSSGEVKISEMAKYGFLLNIAAILLIVLFGSFYF